MPQQAQGADPAGPPSRRQQDQQHLPPCRRHSGEHLARRSPATRTPPLALALGTETPPLHTGERPARPMENISQDILECVLRAVLSHADYARAGAVSREWYSVAVRNRPPSPKLMLPSTAAAFSVEYAKISAVCWLWRPSEIQIQTPPETSSPNFLTVFGNADKGARIDTPPETSSPTFLAVFGNNNGARILKEGIDYPSGARFIGSFPGGWVALALDGWRGHCLLNLSSGERLPLPDVVRTPVIDVDCALGIKSLVLSAPPTTEGKYLVGAITSGATNVAFWRSGLDRWCPPIPPRRELGELLLSNSRAMLPRDPVDDMLYSGGRFYVLYNDEQLVSYMEIRQDGDNDGVLTMMKISYYFQPSDTPERVVMSRYLLECHDHIFMVRHFQDPVQFEFLVLLEEGMVPPQTMYAQWQRCSHMNGRVAFLHRGSSKCVDLGGCALFLGKGCSRSIETGMPDRVIIHPSYNNGGWFYP